MTFTARRLDRSEIDHELIWGTVALFIFGVARWFPFGYFPPPACPFKVLTGYPCCTCGMTRSFLAFVRADLLLAFAWNPLVALGAVGGALYLCYAFIVLVFRLPRIRWSLTARWERIAVRVGVVALFLANWIYLIVVGR